MWLHVNLMVAQISDGLKTYKLDSLIGSGGGLALGSARIAAGIRTGEQENLNVILVHHVGKLITVHLVLWILSIGVESKLDAP